MARPVDLTITIKLESLPMGNGTVVVRSIEEAKTAVDMLLNLLPGNALLNVAYGQLLQAAVKVCDYDWSCCDADARLDMDELRAKIKIIKRAT